LLSIFYYNTSTCGDKFSFFCTETLSIQNDLCKVVLHRD